MKASNSQLSTAHALVDNVSLLVTVSYLISIAALFAASFFPDLRLWGFNVWSYLPLYVRFVLLAISLAALLAPIRLKDDASDSGQKSNCSYFIIAIVSTVVMGLIFYYLRVATYFLGDGSQVISNLATKPAIKLREIGESATHLWLFEWLGAAGKEGARLTYQSISIVSGIFLSAIAFTASTRLFAENYRRILFSLGIISSGYMYLYFGYVENYSLFVLSVVMYLLAGLLISEGKLSRWLALPLATFSAMFHILGVTLLPSAIYLTFAGTVAGNKLRAQPKSVRWTLSIVFVIALVATFVHFYFNDYFFRFAFVPLIADKFTIEGYTMFSGKHLLDLLNIIFLLMPSFFIVVALVFTKQISLTTKKKSTLFLLLATMGCWGAVFIFDPKLGMPRDWDLFAFAGVPLVVGSFYLIISASHSSAVFIRAAILSITLGFLVLIPRAWTLSKPEKGVAIARDYMALDRNKNRTMGYILAHYFRDQGDTARGSIELETYLRDFPESNIVRQASDLARNDLHREVINLLSNVIKTNPHFSDAWSNMSEAYSKLKNYDSAIYLSEVALGLNPNSPPLMVNLGSALYYKGDYDRAEKIFKRAMELDPTLYQTPYNLSHIYLNRGDMDNYLKYLVIASKIEGVHWIVFREIGELYTVRRNLPTARRAFKIALDRGMDSTYIIDLDQRFPGLILK